MDKLILSLSIIPFIISAILLIAPKKLGRILTIGTVFVLSAISVYLYFGVSGPLKFAVPEYFDKLVVGVDILLLLYFGYIAIARKSLLVGIMTVLQLGTLLYLISVSKHEVADQFMVDKLSLFMYLLINIISGVIAAFSLQYIDEEDCSAFRKRFFMSIMMWFIGVMNMIVSVDNLEYFFLLFELTTLASFLFIGFRKDAESIKNALTALWMNQIGGLAILGTMLYAVFTPGYGNTFSSLIENASVVGVLMPFALLAVAALIKGAQMPFSKWLLGAMVAPTPVSALLHSSTMVKIAPFVMLRIAPAIKDTQVATVIICLTGFVFLVAAISALSQDSFKRILAYSTISLLGLMCLMAAVGTEVAVVATLILMMFHGISKCMLFLNAGILERVFHFKKASDMSKLGEVGPFTALVVAVGFMSLLLPPFGAFIGKWFSIETLGAGLQSSRVIGAFVIIAIAIGGAVLSLLYFKVMGLLIARSGENEKIKFEKTHILYSGNMYILLGLIILGILTFPILLGGFFAPVASDAMRQSVSVVLDGFTLRIGQFATLPVIPMIVAFLMLPVTVIIAMFIRFKNVDRVKEYNCGEKVDYRISSFYFQVDKANPYFVAIGAIFFIALVISGSII